MATDLPWMVLCCGTAPLVFVRKSILLETEWIQFPKKYEANLP